MKFEVIAKLSKFNSLISRYRRVVLWGHRTAAHSHHYIHLGYFEFLSKLNVECVWVDDVEDSNEAVVPGSLVMIPDVYLPHLKHTFRPDVSYIIHQGRTINADDIPEKNVLFLYEYRDLYLNRLNETESSESIAPAIAFFPKQRTLLQPWGTDLLSSEFLEAVIPNGNEVIFVGSAWGDKEGKKNGNVKILETIEEIITHRGLSFTRRQNVSSAENINLVRSSRLAVCPSAIGHAQYGYLQCRVFKNISYGQLSLTDVPRFRDVLGEGFVEGTSWEERIDTALQMSAQEYREMVELQQQMIQNYSYLDMWTNMLTFIAH